MAFEIKAPPSRLILLRNTCTSLAATAGPDGAKNLQIAYANLQDAASGALMIGDHLTLTPMKGSSTDLVARGVTSFRLCVKETFEEAGTFAGSVYLGADGAERLQSFDIAVLSSPQSRRFLGGALIVFGVLVGWCLQVLLRQLAARADALLPAAQVAAEVGALKRRIAAVPQVLSGLLGRADELLKSVDTKELTEKDLVPSVITNVFGRPAQNAAKYQQFLTETTAQVEALRVLVRDGVERALVVGRSHPDPLKVALEDLDREARITDPVVARQTAGRVVAALQQKTLPPGAAAVPAPPAATAVPTVAEVHAINRAVSATVWVVWAGLTSLVGIGVLILANDAFGTSADLLKCLLWGIGVQSAGQPLQQMGPSTVTSTLNVSFPKP